MCKKWVLALLSIFIFIFWFSSCSSILNRSGELPIITPTAKEDPLSASALPEPTPSFITTKVDKLDLLAPGAYLIYSSYDKAQGNPFSVSLFVISLNGEFFGTLTSNIERPLSVSMDGSKVAYLKSGDRKVFIRELASKREIKIKLPVLHESCDGIAWSPDGLQIALSCGDIYVSSDPFKEWNSITKSLNDDNSNRQWIYPVWSPKGNKIAYGDPSSTFPTGSLELEVEGGLYLTDTGCATNVVTCKEKTIYYPASDFAFSSPTWSPDGLYLAYLSGPSLNIISIEKNIPSKTVIFPNIIDPVFVDAIAWSPDNQSIAFSYNSDIYKISTSNLDYSLLKKGAGRIETWIVVPDSGDNQTP